MPGSGTDRICRYPARLRCRIQRGSALPAVHLAVAAAGGLPVRALEGYRRHRLHRRPQRLLRRRHVVSELGHRREPVLALDGRLRSPRRRHSRELQQRRRAGRDDRPGRADRRRSAESQDRQPGSDQRRRLPLPRPLPLRQPRPQRRLVLRHLLPRPRRHGPLRRPSLQLALARAVRGLPHLDRLRQDLDRHAAHAGQAALRRNRHVGLPGQDRLAPLRGLRQEHGALARTARPTSSPTAPPSPTRNPASATSVGSPATRSTCSASRRASRTSTTPRSTSSSPATTPRPSRSGPAISRRSSR